MNASQPSRRTDAEIRGVPAYRLAYFVSEATEGRFRWEVQDSGDPLEVMLLSPLGVLAMLARLEPDEVVHYEDTTRTAEALVEKMRGLL